MHVSVSSFFFLCRFLSFCFGSSQLDLLRRGNKLIYSQDENKIINYNEKFCNFFILFYFLSKLSLRWVSFETRWSHEMS